MGKKRKTSEASLQSWCSFLLGAKIQNHLELASKLSNRWVISQSKAHKTDLSSLYLRKSKKIISLGILIHKKVTTFLSRKLTVSLLIYPRLKNSNKRTCIWKILQERNRKSFKLITEDLQLVRIISSKQSKHLNKGLNQRWYRMKPLSRVLQRELLVLAHSCL